MNGPGFRLLYGMFLAGLFAALRDALGLNRPPHDLSLVQMTWRALIVAGCALVMLRLAPKRFFASRNAFDLLLTFILASTLSRAINGSAAFFPTIAVGFLLIGGHRLLTWAACRSR